MHFNNIVLTGNFLIISEENLVFHISTGPTTITTNNLLFFYIYKVLEVIHNENNL